MPIEIVILLLVAVAGIAGSIVLLVFNASLQRAAADGPQDEAQGRRPLRRRRSSPPRPAARWWAASPCPSATRRTSARAPSSRMPLPSRPWRRSWSCGTMASWPWSATAWAAWRTAPRRQTWARSSLCAPILPRTGWTTTRWSVYRANESVYNAFAGKTGELAGTTLVAASVLPDGLRFVSVGDSHIYLFRKGKLYQLNRDHNYFSELLEEVKAGRMTMEEARSHPERAHLTSFVGLEELELVDYNVSPVPLRPGDRVLLCSDGLFKTLSLQEMTEILASSRGFGAQEELLAAVRQKAKRKQDNVTVVLLYCDPVE